MSLAALTLLSALGMIAIAVSALILSRRCMGGRLKWFGIGSALWVVAVGIKIGAVLLTNPPVFALLRDHLPGSWFVPCGGLWMGAQSSLCEIGLTLAAAHIWPHLGSDAPKAISIGVGAGAFEALLLGVGTLTAAAIYLAGLPTGEKVTAALQATAASTQLFWLVSPVERAIAILCHAPARAWVLLGTAQHRPVMVFGGFMVFTFVDGIAGAFHLAGKVGHISLWWIELAILPFALAGLPILWWCLRCWPDDSSPRPASIAAREMRPIQLPSSLE